eukprot:844162-Rhodomonas_salina.3
MSVSRSGGMASFSATRRQPAGSSGRAPSVASRRPLPDSTSHVPSPLVRARLALLLCSHSFLSHAGCRALLAAPVEDPLRRCRSFAALKHHSDAICTGTSLTSSVANGMCRKTLESVPVPDEPLELPPDLAARPRICLCVPTLAPEGILDPLKLPLVCGSTSLFRSD